MALFAQDTHVSIIQSKGEIERMVRKYGADKLASMEDHGRMMLGFEAHGRAVRFEIAKPDPKDFGATERGRRRSDEKALEEADKELRRRWRALLLVIKAKLEAVASGISIFEQEFFGHIVMPGGKTVYDMVKDQVAKAIGTNTVPMFRLEGPAEKDAKK